MSPLPTVASLWIGGKLSWLEQLCLKSFADQGHEITLYSYEPILNLPEGVRAADAAEIMAAEPMLRHARTGSPAIHADMWRLQLMKKTNCIWVDADMYCHQPFDFDSDFVFGWEKPETVCNAVLRLPKHSKTLNQLLEFFEDGYAIAPWLTEDQKRELEAERDAGNPVHLTEMNWGLTGPEAITYFLEQTGEIAHAQPVEVFYPISFRERNQMIMGKFYPPSQITAKTKGVHFWARRMKPRLEEKEHNRPRKGSFMARLIEKHGVEPKQAPIPPNIQPNDDRLKDGSFRLSVGKEALVDGSSIDRLSRKYLLEPKVVKECIAFARQAGEPGNSTSSSAHSGLELSMFDNQDLLNFVLQRSEILFDVPKHHGLIKAWERGETAGLDNVIQDLGAKLAQRSVDVLYGEYLKIRPLLRIISPKKFADIGCGYGVFSYFIAKDFKSTAYLIDLEENDERHFGFEASASAYSNLNKAAAFLRSNGIAKTKAVPLNPEKDDLSKVKNIDFAISTIACGFHFPVDVYMQFFTESVRPGGAIVLDLRKSESQSQRQTLSSIGDVMIIEQARKYHRVLVHKT